MSIFWNNVDILLSSLLAHRSVRRPGKNPRKVERFRWDDDWESKRRLKIISWYFASKLLKNNRGAVSWDGDRKEEEHLGGGALTMSFLWDTQTGKCICEFGRKTEARAWDKQQSNFKDQWKVLLFKFLKISHFLIITDDLVGNYKIVLITLDTVNHEAWNINEAYCKS